MSSRRSILGSILIVSVLFAGVTGMVVISNQYDPPRLAVFVTGVGLEDYGFAAQTESGIKMAQKETTLYYDVFVTTPAQAVQMMKDVSGQERYELVIAIGNDLATAVSTVAQLYPRQKFALIGGNATEATNVFSAYFAVEQAAYLSGIVAAHLVAQSGYTRVIGILASFQTDPEISKIVTAFKNGVTRANTTYGLNVRFGPETYLQSTRDTTMAQFYAYQMFTTQNVSLIFAPVRASLPGVRTAMENARAYFQTHGQPNRLPLVIAEGMNHEIYGLPNPSVLTGQTWIPTSVVTAANNVTNMIVSATLWNEFMSGTFVYGLSNSGVGITPFVYSTTYIQNLQLLMERINEHKQAIINGLIDPLA
ncbi:MAG: BMP family ABC transporter substrate-binding protein [Candidatus Thorarchaeota archaeon]